MIDFHAVPAHQGHGDAVDKDCDGYFDAENSCSEVDCDDTNPDINPGAERHMTAVKMLVVLLYLKSLTLPVAILIPHTVYNFALLMRMHQRPVCLMLQ